MIDKKPFNTLLKTLKDKCDNYESDIKAANLQVKKQKRIISNKDKEITGLKIKTKLVGVGGELKLNFCVA